MDSRKNPLRLALLALVALPAFAFGELSAQQPQAPQQPEAPQQAPSCELKFEQAEIAAGSPAQEMKITLAEGAQVDPALIRSVGTDDASGLQIALVDGQTLVLAVDATGAKAGSWEIRAFDRPEAKGDAQAPLCVGVLTVK